MPARTQWLPIRPGADTALIDGVINYVMANNLYDAAYMRAYTVGAVPGRPEDQEVAASQGSHAGAKGKAGEDYVVATSRTGKIEGGQRPPRRRPRSSAPTRPAQLQAPTALQVLADAVAVFTPEYTSQLTDLPGRQITSSGPDLGRRANPLAVRAGFGLSHWYHGDLHMQGLLTLQALTGNIGVHGGGVTTFAGGLTTTAFDFAHFWAPDRQDLYTLLEPMQTLRRGGRRASRSRLRAAWFMIDNFAQQMSDRNKVDHRRCRTSSSASCRTTTCRPPPT